MKLKIKKLLSAFLVFAMMISMMPSIVTDIHAEEATVVEISEIPSLTIGETLYTQTLENAVPSITDIDSAYYSIFNGSSRQQVTTAQEGKTHHASIRWSLPSDVDTVPESSDYIVKYKGTPLTYTTSLDYGTNGSWYSLYKGSKNKIICMVYINLGKPAASQDEHVHTYSENWSTNTLCHWRAATCEHTNEITDYERHTLVDGKCKCGLEHTHDWDTEWSYNEGQHWHNCKVENCPAYLETEKDGWGFHNADAYGNCITCGMFMFTPSYTVEVVGGTADKATYAPGDTVTITAYAPGTNQKFSGWTSTDDVTFDNTTETTTTFVMPAKDVKVEAIFEEIPVYHVTVVGGTADKEAAGENEYKVELGDIVKITAYDTPDGMKFVGWEVTVNDMYVAVELADASAAETTFEMPEGNVRVDAVYEEIPEYHVTVVGGTADKYEAEEGESVKITANAPGSNQKFVGWEVTVNELFVNVNLEDPSATEITFRMPKGDVKVEAIFEEIPVYHVTVVGGTADKEAAGENEYKVEPGDIVKITAYDTPDGMKFVGWEVTVDEMFVAVVLDDASATETTFEMPEGNVRVDAVYEELPATYHATVVSGTADKYEALAGETITIKAYEAGTGKKFAGWKVTVNDMFVAVELDDASATETTFVMPEGDVKVEAVYENLPATYHATVVGGTANKYEALAGETITIKAYDAPSGKKFVGWEVTVNDMFVAVELVDATAAETTFVMPEGDVKVEAVYEELPATYHATVVGGTADKYEALAGETITIKAYDAPSGKKFAGWKVTVDEMFVKVELANAKSAETTFVMPEGDVRVDAVYEELPTTGDSVNTGDNSMIWLWFGLMIMSGLGLTAAIEKKKSYEK